MFSFLPRNNKDISIPLDVTYRFKKPVPFRDILQSTKSVGTGKEKDYLMFDEGTTFSYVGKDGIMDIPTSMDTIDNISINLINELLTRRKQYDTLEINSIQDGLNIIVARLYDVKISDETNPLGRDYIEYHNSIAKPHLRYLQSSYTGYLNLLCILKRPLYIGLCILRPEHMYPFFYFYKENQTSVIVMDNRIQHPHMFGSNDLVFIYKYVYITRMAVLSFKDSIINDIFNYELDIHNSYLTHVKSENKQKIQEMFTPRKSVIDVTPQSKSVLKIGLKRKDLSDEDIQYLITLLHEIQGHESIGNINMLAHPEGAYYKYADSILGNKHNISELKKRNQLLFIQGYDPHNPSGLVDYTKLGNERLESDIKRNLEINIERNIENEDNTYTSMFLIRNAPYNYNLYRYSCIYNYYIPNVLDGWIIPRLQAIGAWGTFNKIHHNLNGIAKFTISDSIRKETYDKYNVFMGTETTVKTLIFVQSFTISNMEPNLVNGNESVNTVFHKDTDRLVNPGLVYFDGNIQKIFKYGSGQAEDNPNIQFTFNNIMGYIKHTLRFYDPHYELKCTGNGILDIYPFDTINREQEKLIENTGLSPESVMYLNGIFIHLMCALINAYVAPFITDKTSSTATEISQYILSNSIPDAKHQAIFDSKSISNGSKMVFLCALTLINLATKYKINSHFVFNKPEYNMILNHPDLSSLRPIFGLPVHTLRA